MGKNLKRIVSAAVLTTVIAGTGFVNPSSLIGGQEVVAQAAEVANAPVVTPQTIIGDDADHAITIPTDTYTGYEFVGYKVTATGPDTVAENAIAGALTTSADITKMSDFTGYVGFDAANDCIIPKTNVTAESAMNIKVNEGYTVTITPVYAANVSFVNCDATGAAGKTTTIKVKYTNGGATNDIIVPDITAVDVATTAGFTAKWSDGAPNPTYKTSAELAKVNDVPATYTAKYVANVAFNVNGGTTTSETTTVQNVVYATKLSQLEASKPANPTKAGNVFLGWVPGTDATKDVATDESLVVPNYIAKYEEATVQFVGSTAENIKVSNIGTMPGDPTPDSKKKFLGWAETLKDGKLSDVLTEAKIRESIKHLTLKPKYEQAKVEFKYTNDDGTALSSTIVDVASDDAINYVLTPPTAKTVEGKQFIGWDYNGDAKVDAYVKDGKIEIPEKDITDTLTLKAVYGDTITVTFKDGSNTSASTIGDGGIVKLPTARGDVNNKFKEWKVIETNTVGKDEIKRTIGTDHTLLSQGEYVVVTNFDELEGGAAITDANKKKIVIQAQYAAPVEIKLLDSDGTTSISNNQVASESKFTLPTAAEKSGKIFAGWHKIDNTPLDPADDIYKKAGETDTAPTTGTASYEAVYFDAVNLTIVNPVTGTTTPKKVVKGQPLGSPAKIGTETSNLGNIKELNGNLDLDDKNSKAKEMDNEKIKDKLKFSKWIKTYTNVTGKEITEDAGAVDSLAPYYDTTITAVFEATVDVKDVNDNLAKDILGKDLSYTVEYGKDIEITEPTKTGLAFSTWQSGNLVKGEAPNTWILKNVTQNTTVVAAFAESLNITFNDKDGALLEGAGTKVGRGGSYTITSDKTTIDGFNVAGLKFKGFKDQNGKFYKAGDVIADIQVPVQLTAVYDATVTFKDSTGEELKTETVEYNKNGAELVLPTVPDEIAGNKFTGWSPQDASVAITNGKLTNIKKNLLVSVQYGDKVTLTSVDSVTKAVETQEVKIGDNVTVVAEDRTADGLKFKEWRNDSGTQVSAVSTYTFPAKEPLKLKAIYEAENTFKIGGNTSTVSTEYGKQVVEPTVEYINGKTGTLKFLKWDKEIGTATKGETYTAILGEALNVKFVKEDGITSIGVDDPWTVAKETDVTTIAIARGGSVTLPAAPTVTGKTFIYWKDQNGKKYTGTEIKELQQALELTANYGTTVDVTFTDGTVKTRQTAGVGGVVTAPTVTPVDGKTFKAWRAADGTEYAQGAEVSVTAAAELTAVYTAKVTFAADGVNVGDVQTVELGKDAVVPTAPAKEGYTFKAWDKANTAIAADTTINAVYEINKYTVTVDGVAQTVEYGKDAVLPQAAAKEGYTFKGYSADGKAIKADTAITSIYEINKYTVTVDGAAQTVEYGKDAILPQAAAKEGYTFKGYSADGKAIKAQTAITSIYEINKYKVIVNGIEQMVEYGKDVVLPANPTKEGYTFAGWEGQTTGIKADGAVTAKFTQNQAPSPTPSGDAAQAGPIMAMLALALGSVVAFFKREKKSNK